MLEAGLDAKDRQALLGHADITTTQNIYTDVSERRRDIIAEKLNQYIQ
jgi:site-specific recombinase XerD